MYLYGDGVLYGPETVCTLYPQKSCPALTWAAVRMLYKIAPCVGSTPFNISLKAPSTIGSMALAPAMFGGAIPACLSTFAPHFAIPFSRTCAILSRASLSDSFSVFESFSPQVSPQSIPAIPDTVSLPPDGRYCGPICCWAKCYGFERPRNSLQY